jgi:hypothetical protein
VFFSFFLRMRLYGLVALACTVGILAWCTSTKTAIAPSDLPTNSGDIVAPAPEVVMPIYDQTLPTQANMYYIKLDDGWVSGTLIGCNDSLVSASTVLDSLFVSREETLAYVYKLQLGGKDQPAWTSTAVSNKTLQLSSAKVTDGKAMLAFSGTIALWWACDAPRVKAQLSAPALQFPEINAVDITINNISLDQYLSTK